MLSELLRSCFSPRYHRYALRQGWGHTGRFFFTLVGLSALVETTVVLWPVLWVLLSIPAEPVSRYVQAEMPDDLVLTFHANKALPFVSVNRDLPYSVASPPWFRLPYAPHLAGLDVESDAKLLLVARTASLVPQAQHWVDVCLKGDALFIVLDGGVVACQYLFLYSTEEMRVLRHANPQQRARTMHGLEYRVLTEVLTQYHTVPHVPHTVTFSKADVVAAIRDVENSFPLRQLLRFKGFAVITFSLSYWLVFLATGGVYLATMAFAVAFFFGPLALFRALGPLGPWFGWGALLRVAVYSLTWPVLMEVLLVWEPPSLLLSRNSSVVVYSM
eukprot:EG_transcript_18444